MSNLDELSLEDKQELVRLLEEKERRQHYNIRETFFPIKGKYPKSAYPKHMEFIKKGKDFSQRAFIAANRTGKTTTAAYELSYHLTGDYPEEWEGKKFNGPINAWAASISNEMTKNVVQEALLGSPMDLGSGMIPKYRIRRPIKKPGVADAIETVYVKHVTGGLSRLDFKSYEQGRSTFQGTKKDFIWLDEEPTDLGIFSECVTRTSGGEGNDGLIVLTYTPLYGLSDVVLTFLPDGKLPENGVNPEAPFKFVTQVGWDEVPHISEQWKQEALATYSPHERLARSKGIPSLGSGAIYPYMEDTITVDPFEIPFWWKKAYGLDVGWNRTAAIWMALDPESGQIYLYSEHYMGQEHPSVHASAIKARGKWIWGAIDPGANGSSPVDGAKLIDLYEQEGLNIVQAENSVEAGLSMINQRFAAGQLKVFNTLRNFLSEYRIYRRDEKGKVIKKNDHLMDAMRYALMTGIEYAETAPNDDGHSESYSEPNNGRNVVTGY